MASWTDSPLPQVSTAVCPDSVFVSGFKLFRVAVERAELRSGTSCFALARSPPPLDTVFWWLLTVFSVFAGRNAWDERT